MKPFLVTLAAIVLATSLAVAAAPDQPPTVGKSAGDTGADLSEYKNADALWGHLVGMLKGPKTSSTSHEEAARTTRVFLLDAQSSAREFIRRYPEDSRQWDARMIAIQAADLLASFGGREADPAEKGRLLKEIVEGRDAPIPAKIEARLGLIDMHLASLSESNQAAAVAVDEEMAAFRKEYPRDPRNDLLQLLRAKVYEKSDPAKSEEVLRELIRSGRRAVADEAQRQLKLKELMKKPLDLKFTAVDGSTVDLAQQRGKVVLLDFWATWCGPCMMDLPNVIAAYQKYHAKGLEIVGISLDEDKSQLVRVTRERGLNWPQYFDGKVFENEIGSRFGVTSIPAQWLVDKRGYVQSVDRAGGLDGQINKLLAE